MSPCSTGTTPRRPEAEHLAILQAFRDRDVDAAVAATSAHIGSSLASFDDETYGLSDADVMAGVGR